jgi:hypothetical protein
VSDPKPIEPEDPKRVEVDDPKWEVERMEYERAHVETVVVQRFNFFIVLFGVVLVGAANVSDHITRALLCAAAIPPMLMLAITLGRAQTKLTFLLDTLMRRWDTHPAATSNAVANHSSSSRKQWIGVQIPWTCIAILALAGILSLAVWNEQRRRGACHDAQPHEMHPARPGDAPEKPQLGHPSDPGQHERRPSTSQHRVRPNRDRMRG